ncbi:PD-(D/E)XK motif protein [Massilia sp. Dwa41.01b]|uniref:MZA anti-phage system associated PD-(D/E)XK motif protein MzaD n=1 Tax=unclassified Massilia TaxID=2609279 RepID=UPI0016037AE1|nr:MULTISPECIES: MZA anti-phage system associated PD-(D/E)XK motif protein MzaD [unclassified Massilia]QNA87466.1 PD-(D/E)XK motif protein [Massilia sp. Dwa41.01b]QNA98372.1 PD-(D/E)XK motif protein [Massilia sp. Se16.2.3]
MAPLINEEVLAAWRALASDTRGEGGWRCIPISGLAGGRLQAARRFPENSEALIIGFSSVALPAPSMLPAAAGFRVERASVGLPGEWLALVRQEEGGIELFSRMVTDVVAAIAANAESSHQRKMQIFLGRIRAWQHFMSRSSGALSAEAELGLSGELVCLERLVSAGLDLHAAVEGWRGPLNGLQDFEVGSGAIEVKSTLAHDGFPVTIMSLAQLDDSVRQPLFLFGCRFALAADGLSLAAKVAALRSVLESDPAAAALFENALLHAGFVDAHAEHYTRCLTVSEGRFLRVDESFPRLVAANVPAAIRHARYEIDLDGVDVPAATIEHILTMTGAI